MARLMRGRSWNTTRPAPMLVCPTSELPIWPSGRPTSSPEADRRQPGFSAKILSRFGVRAAAMALPARSSHTPKPSIMIRVVGVLLIITSNLFFSFQNGDGRGRPCASRCHAAGWAHVRIVKSGRRENTAPGYRPSPVFSSAPCLNSPVRLPSALLTPGSPRSRSPQCPGPSETRRRSGRRPRCRKVRSALFPPPGEHFTPLPCSSSPNETRCIAVGGFAALQYGVPLAGAALSSRWVPEPPPDADGVTPGWPRSRSPRSRGLQAGAADQTAVHVGLGQQLMGVLCVHGAAVLDGDGAGHAGRTACG